MTLQPTITATHTWDGTHTLPDWLHWDGDRLVLPGRDDDTRPQPGWMLVRWSDGHITVASPQVAARVYGPDGMRGRLERAEAELAERDAGESADAAAGSYAGRAEELEAILAHVRRLHLPVAGEDNTRWCNTCSQEEQQAPPVGWWVPYPCPTVAALDRAGAGATDAGSDLATARATNRRLNHEKQRLESELAAYRRAISTWEFTERGTYIPLRSITAMAKAAGVGFDGTRYELHYERVERAGAQLAAVADLIANHEGDEWAAHPATIALRGILDSEEHAIAQPASGHLCESPTTSSSGAPS
ncbi:hypothetical protein GCM10023084_02970 [Streptomyces lacrimifluminis]|uniref:hypothetical protein n=1 Tax=Streptomyces lacrimifluminis TaxID=1500077 RepID=UPI0031EB1211